MTEQELVYTIALSNTYQLSPQDKVYMLTTTQSATNLFEARHHITDLFPDASERIIQAMAHLDKNVSRAYDELAFVEKNKIECLCYFDTHYPARLRECADAPILLYYKGNTPLNQTHVVSIVGTRNATDYGKHMCERIVKELKELCPDTLIVSGLAYGVDVCAHRAALHNSLNTVGVLAHGLNQIYPACHRDTARQMVSQGGLITEYMSHSIAEKRCFVARNRIVAGMADATIVIESKAKGGSLITADLAFDYGHDVFALPGRAGDVYSEGCLKLIQDNKASIITCGEDLTNALGWVTQQLKNEHPAIQKELFPSLSPEEQIIVSYIKEHTFTTLAEIVAGTGLKPWQLNASVMNLEMQQIIKRTGAGKFCLNV